MKNLILEEKKLKALKREISATITPEIRLKLREYKQRFGIELTGQIDENWHKFWEYCVREIETSHNKYNFKYQKAADNPFTRGEIVQELIYDKYTEEEEFIKQKWNPLSLIMFIITFNNLNLVNITLQDLIYKYDTLEDALSVYSTESCDADVLAKTQLIADYINSVFTDMDTYEIDIVKNSISILLQTQNYTLFHNYLVEKLYH